MNLPYPPHRFFARGLAVAALASAGVLTSGCNLLGVAAYKLSQEQEVPARYTLKKDVPTVVLVENFRAPDLAANDAELLARCLQAKLEEKKVATIVHTEKILDLRDVKPKEFAKMTVPQIAQAIGAQQVIYVDLQSSAINSMTGNSMFQGKAYVAVKVIDAKTGANLYPPDAAEGIGLSYETSPTKGREEGSYGAVRSDLFDGMAKTIGRQFYPWKPSEDEDNK